MGDTWVARDSAIARTVAASWDGESVRNGMIGAISTPHSNPASFSVRHTSSRFRGLGVPGSSRRHSLLSTKPTDTFVPTSATAAHSWRSSMSLRMSEPFVRMENGFAKSRRPSRIPRINW